ncbi:hypothetical protein HHU10_23310, partial [Tsukamurella columbiensis]|nr:hypothetical protein [Tsukamurella columbiensis]
VPAVDAGPPGWAAPAGFPGAPGIPGPAGCTGAGGAAGSPPACATPVPSQTDPTATAAAADAVTRVTDAEVRVVRRWRP